MLNVIVVQTVRRENLTLQAKADIGRIVIKDSLARFNRLAVVWSAGKDSKVTLHLLKTVVYELGQEMSRQSSLTTGITMRKRSKWLTR